MTPRKLPPPDLRTIYAAVAVMMGSALLVLAFWRLGKTDPAWAVVAFVLVFDPDARAACDSAVSRLIFTFLGCGLSVGALWLFGPHRWLIPVCLGVTVFACGYFFGFQGAWRAFLVCVVLVLGASLVEPSDDMKIALARGIEVGAGCLLAVLLSLPFRWLDGRSRSGGR